MELLNTTRKTNISNQLGTRFVHFAYKIGIVFFLREMTNTLNKYFIDAPPSLEGDFYNSISFKFNWTEEFKSGYADRRQNGMHVGDCHVRKDGESWYFDVAYPENYEKYVPEDKCANTN